MSDASAHDTLRLVRGPRGLQLAAGLVWTRADAAARHKSPGRTMAAAWPGADHAVLSGDRLGLACLEGHGVKGRVYSLACLASCLKRQGVVIWTFEEAQGASALPPDAKERGRDGRDGASSTPQTSAETWYWVWAARAGRLSARADRVFTSLEQARAFAARLEDSLGVTPVTVLDAGATREHLERLGTLPGRDLRGCRLEPVRLVSGKRLAALVCLVLLLLGVAFAACELWTQQQHRERLLEEMQGKNALEARRMAGISAVLENAQNHFPSAWLSSVNAADFVRSSVPAMLAFPLVANGWTLESLEASAGGLDAIWRLTAAASLLRPPEGAVLNEKDLSMATESRAAPMLREGPKRDWRALPRRYELDAHLAEITNRFGLKMRLSWKPPATVTVNEERVTCPWVTGTVSWTQVPGYMFDDWPSLALLLEQPVLRDGLIIKHVRWQKKTWSITGEIYAKR